METVAASVAKTNRAVCVEEGWPSYGVTAELAARIQTACFDFLDAPVERVGMAEVPLPYAKNLENAALPGGERLRAAILSACSLGAATQRRAPESVLMPVVWRAPGFEHLSTDIEGGTVKTSLDAAPPAAAADIPRTLSPAGDRTLIEVSQMRDPVGVLSVYVDAFPERARGARPGYHLAAENALRSLRARVDAEVPADRARFLRARFASFEQMTQAFLYARGLGQGRAIFLPLGGGTPIAVAFQMRLQDLVVLDERAHVGPLLAAYDAGRPLGIAVLSQARVRILEQRFGQTHELETSDFQLARATPADLRGRGLGNSSVPQPTGADRDRLRHRTEARRARLLEGVGARLGELAAERGWGLLALCGDPRLSAPVHSRLSSELHVVTAPQSLERLSPAAVALALAPKLEQARIARQVALAHQVLDGAARQRGTSHAGAQPDAAGAQ
jgi:hypothetical protein